MTTVRWWGIFLIGIFTVGTGVFGWMFRAEIARQISAVRIGREVLPKPDLATYAVLVSEIERWRAELSERHREAETAVEKAAVESDARVILESVMPSMMRCWLGTPWDFSGTAEGPGKGKIACGYFVATVLRDAGFQVDRYQLAKQPSENIMRTFVAKESCVLTVGEEYEAFAEGLGEAAPGIYVMGLDTHVAFVVVEDGGFRFIHSSGSRPWCVVDEGREEAQVLKKSNWRMLGKFTGDSGVVRAWLKGEKISVKGT